MSFLTELKNLLFTQETPLAAETKAISSLDGIGRTQPLNYSILNDAAATYLTRNDAQLNSVFVTILNAIQVTAKSIQWNVYKVSSKDENAAKVPAHPLGNLLYRPNPRQSWGDFITQYLGHYIATGNAFILLITNQNGLNKGQVQQLWVMPTSTEVVAGASWMADVNGYRVPRADGGYDTFNADEVLHIKKFNLNNSLYGLSPVTAGSMPLTSINYAMRQRIQQLANGGPRTIFFNDSTDAEGLSEEQEAATVNKITRSTKPVFIDYKVGTAQLGLSPVDLDLLNAVQADAGMVADLLNYPSILLSGTKSNTYNNVAEAQKALYTNCVIPHLHELRDGLNFKLGGAYKDKVYIDLDLSNIEVLRPNLTALIAAATSADFLTINEKRKMAGYQSIDGGDGFLRGAATQYLASVDETDPTAADAYAAGDTSVTGD